MKNENLSCVPKVRFPGFQDPWKVVYGNDIFATVSEKNGGAELSLLALSQELGAIPRSMIDYHVLVSEVSKANYKVVRAGDFIISLRSFQGGIEYSCYDGLCSPAYIVLRNGVPISHLFYKYFFKTTGLISALNRNLEGIRDGKMVSYKQFSEIRIPYPSLDEQYKIASCLSSIDDVIKETEEKVRSLKEHKKGLMQLLFPAKGKCNPTKRIIENDGEWKEVTIGKVCQMEAGKFIPASKISSSGLFPCYGGNGLRGYVNNPNNSGTHPIIGRQGALCGNVLLAKGKFYATEHAIVVTNTQTVDALFLYHLLNYLDLNKYSVGQAQPGLSVSKLLHIGCSIPTSIGEQLKIASCLSSIDDIITAYKEKLTLLKLHKKGLIQLLFPQIIF